MGLRGAVLGAAPYRHRRRRPEASGSQEDFRRPAPQTTAECCAILKEAGRLLNQLSNTAPDSSHTQHRERLKRNMIYRGGPNRGNQCTRVQRGLNSTAGNEEYVLVPNGNVLRLAT